MDAHVKRPSMWRWWIALVSFLAIAVFFLWEEHKAHILGIAPWLLLLACPLLHLFMHHGHGAGHGGHAHGGDPDGGEKPDSHSGGRP